MEGPLLTKTHKYAAAALFSLALHQSQIHQTHPVNPLVSLDDETIGEGASIGKGVSVSHNPALWIHDNSGLLLPVFGFLGVGDQAWDGLKETACSSSQVRHHVGSFLRLLAEESEGISKDRSIMELAVSNTADATALERENLPAAVEESERSQEYEIKYHEKYSTTEKEAKAEMPLSPGDITKKALPSRSGGDQKAESNCGKTLEEAKSVSHQRKMAVLYELLSACVPDGLGDQDNPFQGRKGYDARHRVALRLLATWFSTEWTEMEAVETMVACAIMDAMKAKGEKEDKDQVIGSHSDHDALKRGTIIGAAAVTGGALMAITGGLAAPAIAGGFGALAPTLGAVVPAIGTAGFAAAATAMGSAAGSIAVAASFGAAGAGLSGTKMARRTADVEEFEFKDIGDNHKQGRLAVGILVSGLVFEREDFIRPWEGCSDTLERCALQWESENLIALSTAIQEWLTSKIATELMKKGAIFTVFSTILAAVSLPASLLTAYDMIDSKWAIGIDRSDKAGKLLAEVLLKGLHGNRPVTLIGYSLGARLIFSCLQCLAEAEGDHAGLVERVVLLGAPVSIKDENWGDVRKLVAGRFVNAYSENDWTLGIAFRASLLSQGLAGIQPVDIPGVENVDVTELIDGHSSYIWMTKQILEQLKLDNYYPDFAHTKLQNEKISKT